MLPELLGQIAKDQPVASVSAHGAYDTKACHNVIAARHACAVIPARRNARAWPESTPGVKARNETVRASRRLGQTIWKRWSGYHQPSRVETKMHCFKLLGERVMAREFDRQVAQLQIRAAILNRFIALGTPETQRVA
ncbi:ISSpo9, transposase [Novosphingobium pentaromativorans US6-1]|uniref:ISSpo9, transposase n=1 Tax=Novosphingobium pentaromativorans US6-1 TaxID=1088721 RepID=G6EFS1_9SPHN|nr:ISSpo9, transposase [Novosphingobium pentaromativorans US6-1]